MNRSFQPSDIADRVCTLAHTPLSRYVNEGSVEIVKGFTGAGSQLKAIRTSSTATEFKAQTTTGKQTRQANIWNK